MQINAVSSFKGSVTSLQNLWDQDDTVEVSWIINMFANQIGLGGDSVYEWF